MSESSEVLIEVLNLIGTWSSFLHHMNLALTIHPPNELKTEGVSSICETWQCFVEGQCF